MMCTDLQTFVTITYLPWAWVNMLSCLVVCADLWFYHCKYLLSVLLHVSFVHFLLHTSHKKDLAFGGVICVKEGSFSFLFSLSLLMCGKIGGKNCFCKWSIIFNGNIQSSVLLL